MSKRGSRSSGYTKEEDKFLCQVYIEISQDPVTSAYQTSEKCLSNIIKNFEKFKDGPTLAQQVPNPCGFGYTSSESENPTPDVARQASPGLCSSSLNLDDENGIIGGSPSQRPIEVKKSKLKRKCDDPTSAVLKTLEERSRQLLEQLKKAIAEKQRHFKLQSKNYALKKIKEEDKILFKNLNTIEDLNIRAHFQTRQQEILRKRADQEALTASTSFGQYFSDLGGIGK